VLETVGRSGMPAPELGPRIPGSVELGGRVIERRGVRLLDFEVVFAVVAEEEEEGVDITGPAIEAYICDSWMCVPGPGR